MGPEKALKGTWMAKHLSDPEWRLSAFGNWRRVTGSLRGFPRQWWSERWETPRLEDQPGDGLGMGRDAPAARDRPGAASAGRWGRGRAATAQAPPAPAEAPSQNGVGAGLGRGDLGWVGSRCQKRPLNSPLATADVKKKNLLPTSGGNLLWVDGPGRWLHTGKAFELWPWKGKSAKCVASRRDSQGRCWRG